MEEINRKMEKICEKRGKNDDFMIESNWRNVKEYFKLNKFYTKNCEYLSKKHKKFANIYQKTSKLYTKG